MSLYAEAAAAIRAHSEEHQAKLYVEFGEAMVHMVRYVREAAVKGVRPESPAYAVCQLLAKSLQFGREDGWPEVRIPVDIKPVLLAAEAAGCLAGVMKFGDLGLYHDGSGISHYGMAQSYVEAAYKAWQVWSTYRDKQTWAKL